MISRERFGQANSAQMQSDCIKIRASLGRNSRLAFP